MGSLTDAEKHKKFTQSKFDVFFLHKPFSGFYKGNYNMQYEEINTDLNKHGFQVCMFFPGLILELLSQ